MPMTKIYKIAEKNNGTITNVNAKKEGILRGTIKYFADKGMIEKVSRGIYVLPGIFEDEYLITQNRFKQGIFSLETALYLHNLTDRTPNTMSMNFPQGYNMGNAKKNGIKTKGMKIEFYKLGIEEVKTPSGNIVKVYNKEKTLVDILRTKNKVDIQIVTNAYKEYIKLKERNIPLLSQYAKILGVEDKLKSYLEVLL